MPSVVIIHAAEDALPARALADKLRVAKLTPVIEQPPGEELRASVRSAAVTLALWSPRSAMQQALFDEVTFAKSKSKVIHARMQNTPTPEQFRNDKSIDLTGWRGEDDFPAWRELAKAVTQLAGVPAPPPPGPKGPPGFFQPGGADAPQPAPQAQRGGAAKQAQPQRSAPQPARTQAPPPRPQPQRAAAPPPPRASEGEEKKRGLPIVPILIALLLIGGGVGGYFVWSNMQGSQAAASAWDNVARNDAAALRAFIDGDPGQYRDEAQAALAALEEQTFDAAREEDTIAAFENFLNDFPESEHAIEARGRIAELQSMPPADEAPIEPLPGETTNPDLLPPDSATGVAPDEGGPAPLTPAPTPAPEQPAPSDQPLPSN